MRWLVLLGMLGCQLGPLDVTGLQCTETRACGAGFTCWQQRCVADEDVPDADAGAPDAGPVDSGVRDAGVADAGRDAGPVDAGDPDAGAPDAGEPDAGRDAGPLDAGLPTGINLLINADFEQATMDGGVVGWRSLAGRLFTGPDAGLVGRAGRLQSSSTGGQLSIAPSVDVPGVELGMLFCASVWARSESDAGVDLTLTLRDRFFDGGTASSSGTRVTVFREWRLVKEEHASFGESTLQLRVTTTTRFDAGEGFWIDEAWLLRAATGSCP